MKPLPGFDASCTPPPLPDNAAQRAATVESRLPIDQARATNECARPENRTGWTFCVAQTQDGFWAAFLRGLLKRGLSGVRLVISDAHAGLKHAIGTVLAGTGWQRCRAHFMRNVPALPKVRATIRLVGAVLLDQDVEWATSGRRYSNAESMARLRAALALASEQELLMAMA